MIQSAYNPNTRTPFVRTSCTTAGSTKVKSSRVSSSSSTNLRILAARSRSSKSLLNGGKVSAVVELAADLLETKERQQNTIRKRAELRVNPPPPEAAQTDRFSPVELQKFASRLEEVYRNSPSVSPKEDLGQDWRKYQGSNDWEGLLDPLSPKLRREILKYGEFAEATYAAFDFDAQSRYCGSCRYNRQRLLEKLHLQNTGYRVSKYLYAMSDVHMPKFFGRSNSMDPWSKDSNWMGYVAVSNDEETKRLGRRDIMVAWRGTVTQLEWMENLRDILHPVGDLGCSECTDIKVERGFLSIYTSKNDATRYNKHSASEQVTEEIRRLVALYTGRGEEVSISICGHSLGGALALLNAFEIAAKGVNVHANDPARKVPVTVFSFGAPRVGNGAFKDTVEEHGVKVLRVVGKQDVVPKMPGILFNEGMEKYEKVIGHVLESLPWSYKHVGVELGLEIKKSPFLKSNPDLAGCHNFEVYLHLLDGFESSSAPFRVEARRDVSLINKASDLLRKDLMVPSNWHQLENKGLVHNCYGRWVQPERDADDVPSPHGLGSFSS
ncbi:hypothetical protein SUGI_0379550 [Cryptomeria japonica]|uniref:phospholipase A1-Igamma1, chloroplastic n=1 Tax=Cryptomeria japonica TaxID=3369 RepID=UPI002408B1B9|nr:phospholipase A1-Igamma1, chloroplastic [Cryptomeria japonica]GLJ20818.1 hypothetical protein SUGI_0379550 [Cryptomeria japonica]